MQKEWDYIKHTINNYSDSNLVNKPYKLLENQLIQKQVNRLGNLLHSMIEEYNEAYLEMALILENKFHTNYFKHISNNEKYYQSKLLQEESKHYQLLNRNQCYKQNMLHFQSKTNNYQCKKTFNTFYLKLIGERQSILNKCLEYYIMNTLQLRMNNLFPKKHNEHQIINLEYGHLYKGNKYFEARHIINNFFHNDFSRILSYFLKDYIHLHRLNNNKILLYKFHNYPHYKENIPLAQLCNLDCWIQVQMLEERIWYKMHYLGKLSNFGNHKHILHDKEYIRLYIQSIHYCHK